MILTCDIGTSSLKLGIIDGAGNLRAFFRAAYARPSAGAWQRAFLRAVRSVPDDLKRGLRAVGVSGHAPTLVPVDERGLPAAEPLMWFEGNPPRSPDASPGSYFLDKAGRFAAENPAAYARTDCFLPTGEYLAFTLTGNKTAFIPHAGFEPYYWNGESITGSGLAESKFPRLTTVGKPAGETGARAARATGIPPKTPVFCGGADFLMSILGSGAHLPGLANDRGGTSEAVNYCDREPYSSALFRPVPGFSAGTWNLGGFIPYAGLFHARLKETLVGRRGTFDDFAALADDVAAEASALRFVPPRSFRPGLNPRLALSSAFRGAAGGTAKGEYALAFFEYIGFSLRGMIEDLEKRGRKLRALHASGGLAKNRRLSRLKATVTGRTVKIPAIEDSELLGNAAVALAGLGEFRSSEEAAAALVRFKTEYDPDPARRAFYADRFAEFREREASRRG